MKNSEENRWGLAWNLLVIFSFSRKRENLIANLDGDGEMLRKFLLSIDRPDALSRVGEQRFFSGVFILTVGHAYTIDSGYSGTQLSVASRAI